jgi:hypothetical protein
MKKVMGALLLAIAAQAQADTDKDCAAASKIARTVMKARQSGVVAADFMAQADVRLSNEDTKALTKQLILSAYERDRYYSEDMQKRAAVDFANDTYMLCMNMPSKKGAKP